MFWKSWQHVGMGYVEQFHSARTVGPLADSTDIPWNASGSCPWKNHSQKHTLPLRYLLQTSHGLAPQMQNFHVQKVKVRPMNLYQPSGFANWQNQEVQINGGLEQKHTTFTDWIWICPTQLHPLIVPYHLLSSHTIWYSQEKTSGSNWWEVGEISWNIWPAVTSFTTREWSQVLSRSTAPLRELPLIVLYWSFNLFLNACLHFILYNILLNVHTNNILYLFIHWNYFNCCGSICRKWLNRWCWITNCNRCTQTHR